MPTHFICFYGSHCQLLLLYCKILREFCNRFTCLHQLIKTFTNTHIDTVTEYMIIPSSKTYSIFATYKEPWAGCMLSLQSCATLCNPMDCSPPGFSGHGIPQGRTLEWVAILSSRGSSWRRDWTCSSWSSCSCCAGRRILHSWATREALFSIWDVLRQQGGKNYHDKA